MVAMSASGSLFLHESFEDYAVGTSLHGVAVGLKPTDHGTTAVYLGSLWLGDLEQTDAGGLRPTVSSPRIGNEMKSVTHVLR
jgi:hypothetical protein